MAVSANAALRCGRNHFLPFLPEPTDKRGSPGRKSSKREHIMYRHQRQQCTKIPANGHLSKGRSAAIARTATEIAQYEEAVENDADPGMPCCFDSRKSASRDDSATATTMPTTDPPLLGGRRLVMPGPTGRYKTGRSPISAHIHGKLNREEGNPQKHGEESPQHALRATAPKTDHRHCCKSHPRPPPSAASPAQRAVMTSAT